MEFQNPEILEFLGTPLADLHLVSCLQLYQSSVYWELRYKIAATVAVSSLINKPSKGYC